MIRRLLVAALIAADLAFALVIVGIAVRYNVDRPGYHLGSRWQIDWIDLAIFLIPAAIALFGVLTTVWVFRLRRQPRIFPVTRWTLFLNTHLLLAILTWQLVFNIHFVEIAYDGTAYWIFELYCLFYGVPLLIAALVVGGIGDIIRAVRRKNPGASAS